MVAIMGRKEFILEKSCIFNIYSLAGWAIMQQASSVPDGRRRGHFLETWQF